MSLQGESTLTDAEKVTEMRKHLEYLSDHLERMSHVERGFIQNKIEQLERYGDHLRVSNKELFWTRDLILKY
jgi:hypothetical protein